MTRQGMRYGELGDMRWSQGVIGATRQGGEVAES